MPANDSSTGGFLTPTSIPPQSDDALDTVLQALVTGVTGLPGTNVRRRWLSVPLNEPEVSVTWVAIGVTDTKSQPFPVITHEDGSSTVRRQEYLTIVASFYGPLAGQYAGYLRDGLALDQNCETLQAVNADLTSVGSIRTLHEKINNVYRHRFDLPFYVSRQIVRTYSILNLATAEIILRTVEPLVTTTIEVPD